MFEYLALGKPTITVRSPNIQDLFEHGTHLRMGQAGDVAELAENIEWMMNNPEEAESSAAPWAGYRPQKPYLGRPCFTPSVSFEEMMAEAK